MEKDYKTLMLLVSLLLWGSGLRALDQKNGVYQIGTAEDLVAFSELVNGGEYAVNAVLTADIDLSGSAISLRLGNGIILRVRSCTSVASSTGRVILSTI